MTLVVGKTGPKLTLTEPSLKTISPSLNFPDLFLQMWHTIAELGGSVMGNNASDHLTSQATDTTPTTASTTIPSSSSSSAAAGAAPTLLTSKSATETDYNVHHAATYTSLDSKPEPSVPSYSTEGHLKYENASYNSASYYNPRPQSKEAAAASPPRMQEDPYQAYDSAASGYNSLTSGYSMPHHQPYYSYHLRKAWSCQFEYLLDGVCLRLSISLPRPVLRELSRLSSAAGKRQPERQCQRQSSPANCHSCTAVNRCLLPTAASTATATATTASPPPPLSSIPSWCSTASVHPAAQSRDHGRCCHSLADCQHH